MEKKESWPQEVRQFCMDMTMFYDGQGPPTSECFSQLKTAYSARNGAPQRAEKPYLCPFVPKRREIPKPVPTKAFLQPAKAAAMCTDRFYLSSKWIAPTDNVRPKLHDEYNRHQWLKG